MNDAFGAASLVVMAALLGGVVASILLASPAGATGPIATNFRGFRTPVALGVVLALAVVVTRLLVVVVIAIAGGSLGVRLVAQLGAVVLAFGAGLFDDLQEEPSRGIARQLGQVVRGRIPRAAVKLVVALGAGAVAVAVVGGDGARYALGIPLIAGCANLWNLFDVRPGRAGKLFVPAAVAVGALGWPDQSMLLTAVAAGAVAALLPADLEERAMLGDGGAYVLGAVVGIGLYDSLGTTGLAVALGVVVVLHVLSETVTLSRLIRAVAPLRLFDAVGRLEPLEPEPTSSPGENGGGISDDAGPGSPPLLA